MPRLARSVSLFGVPYHITVRGNRQYPIFDRVDDYEKYLAIIARAKQKFKFQLFNYSLMTNHVHLLLWPKRDEDLALIMQKINLEYSIYWKKRIKRNGHLWQGRFDSKPVDNDEYLLTCGIYIELNPVRAGICELPEKYRWSSYPVYAFGKIDPLIDLSPTYLGLSRSPAKRREVYKDLAKMWRLMPRLEDEP